jgi:hypothetical protein
LKEKEKNKGIKVDQILFVLCPRWILYLISYFYHNITFNFIKLGYKSDTIRATKKQSDSYSDVKCATVQFYGNSHNSQSDRWIRLNLYVESPDMFSYIGLKFQVDRSSGRHFNTGPQRLYEFCYLLLFNLWTSYLIRILFLQGCGRWFWKFSSSTRIFNELQYNLQVW